MDLASLKDAMVSFLCAEDQLCRDALAAVWWKDGYPTCPHCGEKKCYNLKTTEHWECSACGKQFSIFIKTMFEKRGRGIKLAQWFGVIWLVSNGWDKISPAELSRALEVSPRTATYMLERLRTALLVASAQEAATASCESIKKVPRGGMFQPEQAEKMRAAARIKWWRTETVAPWPDSYALLTHFLAVSTEGPPRTSAHVTGLIF